VGRCGADGAQVRSPRELGHGESLAAVGGPALEDIRGGDVEAFGLLFDAHAREVFVLCARRCRDRDLAEDLMSVVFLQAWDCRDRAVLVDGSLRPWLFAITRNVLRNAQRSRRREAAALARFAVVEPKVIPGVEEEVVETLSAREESGRAAEALLSLPVGHREAARLCWQEGLDSTQASVVLGVPAGTVRSRLSMARGRLRRVLRSGDDVNTTAAADMYPSGGGSAPAGGTGDERRQ
jgi:RNA polymerase sigma factor (sigma-70 family)